MFSIKGEVLGESKSRIVEVWKSVLSGNDHDFSDFVNRGSGCRDVGRLVGMATTTAD
jgi:hypothetical protein